MDLGLNLKVKCHVNKNGDGDRFVGIKADADQAMVYFPMGYRLPDNEEDIRDDILKLISVLAEFRSTTVCEFSNQCLYEYYPILFGTAFILHRKGSYSKNE